MSMDKPRSRKDLQQYFDVKFSKFKGYSSQSRGYIGFTIKSDVEEEVVYEMIDDSDDDELDT